MQDAWQILRDAGLPLEGARGAASGHAPGEIAAALRDAVAEQPSGREAEALGAFVFAWHHHWPASFAAAFAEDAAALLGWASLQFEDDGRYLKLRRIAIENLALVL